MPETIGPILEQDNIDPPFIRRVVLLEFYNPAETGAHTIAHEVIPQDLLDTGFEVLPGVRVLVDAFVVDGQRAATPCADSMRQMTLHAENAVG